MATVLKSLNKPKKKTHVNFKLTEGELEKIQSRADKYARGNVSAWIRYAAINLEPPASELVQVKS